MFSIIPLVMCCSLVGIAVMAQKKNESYQLQIRKAVSPVKIDGVVDDAAWQQADVTSQFRMVLPMDTSAARLRTDVRMTYDDKNLYLVVENYTTGEGPYMVESLRRDFSFFVNNKKNIVNVPKSVHNKPC
jgi:hypothetical protein